MTEEIGTHFSTQRQHGSSLRRMITIFLAKEPVTPLVHVSAPVNTDSMCRMYCQVAQRHVLEERRGRRRTYLRGIRCTGGDYVCPSWHRPSEYPRNARVSKKANLFDPHTSSLSPSSPSISRVFAGAAVGSERGAAVLLGTASLCMVPAPTNC